MLTGAVCQPLDYETVDMKGKTVTLLTHELNRVHRATEKHEKGTSITGGFLEKIIEKKDHPARKVLIWNNLYFGLSRRKCVKMRPDWEAGNSPFFLHPEIIDEVVKYMNIPKDMAEGVRQFAKQKAAVKAKAEQVPKKAAKPTVNSQKIHGGNRPKAVDQIERATQRNSRSALRGEQLLRFKKQAFTKPDMFSEFAQRSDAAFIGCHHDATKLGPDLR